MAIDAVSFIFGIIASFIGGALLLFITGHWKRLVGFFLFRSEFKKITGIDSVDKAMGAGTSPENSLKQCNDNIRFLGIAANKLVNSDEFNPAIKRCNRPDAPIQFLLSDPNNQILEQAAGRAGKPVEEYRDMVNTTLERLKDLKRVHGFNIEVRLYRSDRESGPPSFRLFFIDNKSVLVSYYVFGEGDGLQMPQVRISKPINKRDNENFYFPFNHYFNALWEASNKYPLDEA